jgi:hypothetical protein
MTPIINSIRHHITSLTRRKDPSARALGVGLPLKLWTGILGAGAAYFFAKKICHSFPFTRAIQNIYSTFFGSSTANQKVESPSEIEKINNNLYISRRAQNSDLTFALSRLTDDNLPVWWKLYGRCGNGRGCEVARELFDDQCKKSWTAKQKYFFTAGIEAGAMAFRETLNMYEDSRRDTIRPEIWISYVLAGKDIDPSQPIHESLFPRLEIAMTAMTHPDIPVVVHIGIGRTPHYTKSVYNGTLPEHKGLSIPLHGFTAKAILETPQGHDKLWMYTAPVAGMAGILEKALPEDVLLKGKENMPIIYEKDSLLCVKNRAGQIVSTLTREECVSGKTTFLNHMHMHQKITVYAADYRALADSFDPKKFPESN